MNSKIIINPSKMIKGHSGVTSSPFLWAILDDKQDGNVYEIQIHKIEFPSSRKSIRESKNKYGQNAIQ